MEYIKNIDTSIDNVLDNDIVYSLLIILLIFLIVFPNMADVCGVHLYNISSSIFNISNTLNQLLYLLCIIYILNKDIRIVIMLTIIFLIIYEKQNIKMVNKEILQILVANISLEQRLEILENNTKN